MSEPVVIAELQSNGVLQLILNRPDKLNALNEEVLSSLSQQFNYATEDSSVKLISITGQGKAFCAGADINQLAKADAISGYSFAKRGQAVFDQLEHCGKPSIAIVNGFAFGGGCELAMSASIRIASSKAKFGQPEVKLGVIPGYGGTQRLSRLVGKGRALDLCLTGRFIDAATAYDWGLVTGVAEPDALSAQAAKCVSSILEQAPIALASVLKTIHQGFDLPLKDGLELEANQFALTCATEDKQEGVSAFLEKRTASFKNK